MACLGDVAGFAHVALSADLAGAPAVLGLQLQIFPRKKALQKTYSPILHDDLGLRSRWTWAQSSLIPGAKVGDHTSRKPFDECRDGRHRSTA